MTPLMKDILIAVLFAATTKVFANRVDFQSAVATHGVCAESAVAGVCECKHKSSYGKQCSGCLDIKKWGYGCDMDCPAQCVLGCNFVGDCIAPPNCKETGTSRAKVHGADQPTNSRGECTACKDGFSGLHCEYECPANCDGSSEGWCSRGGKCYTCAEGFYGPTCEEKCPALCPKCVMLDNTQQNQKGTFMPAGSCPKQCDGDAFGDTCESPCPSHCDKVDMPSCLKESGRCLACEGQAWWGSKCEAACSAGCKDGKCLRSAGECKKGCATGYWGGASCEHQCPTNCADPECDHVTGFCSSCKSGFFGPQCERPCPEGTVGSCDFETGLPEDCEEGKYPLVTKDAICSPCPEGCAGDSCDRDGSCTQGCSTGFWGTRCETFCAPKCDGDCDKRGTCEKCIAGFTGKMCTKRCDISCATCHQSHNAVGPNSCTSCPADKPSELSDSGKCKCIDGASIGKDGTCGCDAPQDPMRQAYFDVTSRKLCRSVCVDGYKEALSDTAMGEAMCLKAGVFFDVYKAMDMKTFPGDGFGQGGCADDEFEIALTDESNGPSGEKECIRKDFVRNIVKK